MKTKRQLGMVAYASNSGIRGRSRQDFSKFYANLVYIESFRSNKTTQWDPVSEKEGKHAIGHVCDGGLSSLGFSGANGVLS